MQSEALFIPKNFLSILYHPAQSQTHKKFRTCPCLQGTDDLTREKDTYLKRNHQSEGIRFKGHLSDLRSPGFLTRFLRKRKGIH